MLNVVKNQLNPVYVDALSKLFIFHPTFPFFPIFTKWKDRIEHLHKTNWANFSQCPFNYFLKLLNDSNFPYEAHSESRMTVGTEMVCITVGPPIFFEYFMRPTISSTLLLIFCPTESSNGNKNRQTVWVPTSVTRGHV